MAGPDIFISYNREDAAIARTFRDALAQEGYDVWWMSTMRSGETYDEVTEQALRAARAVVVLWSPRSVMSRWVRSEATIADRNGTFVPVTIEACERPVMFELTQTADLSHWRGEPEDPAWQALLDDIRRTARIERHANGVHSTRPDPSSGGDIPFVGMMPLAHRGDDDELALLADDLTEDMTRELAQGSFIRVISASTMRESCEAHVPLRQVGQDLNARYLIEGKIQRVGPGIRVTLQLMDASTGSMLRAARHTRDLAHISASPEEFPAALASEFGEAITQIEAKRAMDRAPPHSGWDHVMRALALMERLGPETIPQAILEAEQAIAQSPYLGLAHAVLARLINLAATPKQRAHAEVHRRRIQEHIARAMQLDGNNPPILHFVVSAYVNLGDGEAALRIARRALELNPNSPHSHYALGQALHICGRYREAVDAFRQQMRLTSHDLNRPHGLLLLGVCLILDDRLDEAEEVLDRSLALQPSNGAVRGIRAIAQAMAGNEPAARATAAHVRDAEDAFGLDGQAWIARQLFGSRGAEADAILRRLWN